MAIANIRSLHDIQACPWENDMLGFLRRHGSIARLGHSWMLDVLNKMKEQTRKEEEEQ